MSRQTEYQALTRKQSRLHNYSQWYYDMFKENAPAGLQYDLSTAKRCREIYFSKPGEATKDRKTRLINHLRALKGGNILKDIYEI